MYILSLITDSQCLTGVVNCQMASTCTYFHLYQKLCQADGVNYQTSSACKSRWVFKWHSPLVITQCCMTYNPIKRSTLILIKQVICWECLVMIRCGGAVMIDTRQHDESSCRAAQSSVISLECYINCHSRESWKGMFITWTTLLFLAEFTNGFHVSCHALYTSNWMNSALIRYEMEYNRFKRNVSLMWCLFELLNVRKSKQYQYSNN